jgi:hypothetical protein
MQEVLKYIFSAKFDGGWQKNHVSSKLNSSMEMLLTDNREKELNPHKLSYREAITLEFPGNFLLVNIPRKITSL